MCRSVKRPFPRAKLVKLTASRYLGSFRIRMTIRGLPADYTHPCSPVCQVLPSIRSVAVVHDMRSSISSRLIDSDSVTDLGIVKRMGKREAFESTRNLSRI